MKATKNGRLYGVKCGWCGVMFSTRSHRAKYCSDSHRGLAFRARKTGNGRTLHDLSDETINDLQQLLNISELAYNQIFSLLENYGAKVATEATRAAIHIANELITEMERVKHA